MGTALSMFLAKHTTPICSYLYLAWDIKKEAFGEHSHLVQNRVQVAVEVCSIWKLIIQVWTHQMNLSDENKPD